MTHLDPGRPNPDSSSTEQPMGFQEMARTSEFAKLRSTFRGFALCRRVIPLRPGRPCPVATLGSPPGRSSGAAFRFAELQTQRI